MSDMAVMAQPVKSPSTLRTLLERSRGELEKALVSRIDPDQFIRIALTTIQRKPKLLECDGQSLMACLMESAQMGLPPDNAWGTYLVPFRDKTGKPHCQLIICYRGLLRIVRRSGQIANIWAEVVRNGDVFKVVKGDSPRLIHEPKNLDGKDFTHAYAIAHEFDTRGEIIKIPEFIVMTFEQIESIRCRSKSPNEGPWQTDWVDMAKKTVLRNLCKYLPVDPIAQQALSIEDTAYDAEEVKKVTKELPKLEVLFDTPTVTEEERTALDTEISAGDDTGPNEVPQPRRPYTKRKQAEAAPESHMPVPPIQSSLHDGDPPQPPQQEQPTPFTVEDKLRRDCLDQLASLKERKINVKLDPDFDEMSIDRLRKYRMDLIGMGIVK